MNQSLPAFALATGIPILLLSLAAFLGGWWIAIALIYALFITNGLDRIIYPKLPRRDMNPEMAEHLSKTLAIAHWCLLFLGIGALSWTERGFIADFSLFLAFGLFFGQVSNSNAHELIHRPKIFARQLGASVYTSLFFGHHATAHTAIHHRFVCTPNDPNTAKKGESYYRFAVRAWVGSFKAGLKVENTRLSIKNLPKWHASNAYWHYCFGAVLAIALTTYIFGIMGFFLHVAFGFFATSQLLLSDYVQHYGLRRRKLDDGRFEPVGLRHSWNAPHWFTSLLMLNAPRHSDHHKNPLKPYTELENLPADQAPVLPHSLPIMGFIALHPRRWQKTMAPHLDRWRNAENQQARPAN
ncbi:fatty acid desaturase [Rhodobacterales bacterium HTCC2150]|nr:fatty acid desaturase [Rhodobacterales bacterium HTCC2150] [Rhodobacteraceae bacterium HTCC2150]